MRTYEVKHEFRFDEGVWLYRKSRQIRKEYRKRPILHHNMCELCSELPTYISTMDHCQNFDVNRKTNQT